MIYDYFVDLSAVNTYGTQKYDKQFYNYIISYKKKFNFLILCSKKSIFYNCKKKNIKVFRNPFHNSIL